jgi:hypothetical protein
MVALLFQTKRGSYLRTTLPFMKATPWIKHDEHYHVDFSLPCRPLSDYAEKPHYAEWIKPSWNGYADEVGRSK